MSSHFDARLMISLFAPALCLAPAVAQQAANQSAEAQFAEFQELKQRLGWDRMRGEAREYWENVEGTNRSNIGAYLDVARGLEERGCTLSQWRRAFRFSNTLNVKASLHFLDYVLTRYRPTEEWEFSDEEQSATWEDVDAAKRRTEVDRVTGSARAWWLDFERAHRDRPAYLVRVLDELASRKQSIDNLFLAQMNGRAYNMAATLHYLDYAHAHAEATSTSDSERAGPFRRFGRPPTRSEINLVCGRFAAPQPEEPEQMTPAERIRRCLERATIMRRVIAQYPANYEWQMEIELLRRLLEELEDEDPIPAGAALAALHMTRGDLDRARIAAQKALERINALPGNSPDRRWELEVTRRLREIDALRVTRSEEPDGYRLEIAPEGEASYEQLVVHLDSRGRVCSRTYAGLAVDARPTGTTVVAMRYELPADRFGVNTVALDESGVPHSGEHWAAVSKRVYDDVGHIVDEAFFDAAGNPMRVKKTGPTHWACGRDKQGRIVEAYWTGKDPQEQTTKGTVESHETREYNDEGTVTFGRNLAENGEVLSSYKVREDLAGRRVEELDEYFDRRPYAKRRIRYDAHSRVIETTYRDEDGDLTENEEGYARRLTEYRPGSTESSDWIRRRYLNRHKEPASKPCAEHVRLFDDRDRLIEGRYLDRTGALVDAPGCALYTYEYHDGYKVSRRFNADERPTEVWFKKLETDEVKFVDGCYGSEYEYDEAGGLIQTRRYYDQAAKGYFKSVRDYDADERLRETAFFDLREQPAVNELGVHRIETTCDEQGRVIRERYYDVDGAPTRTRDGYLTLSASYADGFTERTYRGYDGGDGFAARAVRTYGGDNVVTSVTYLDEAGAPVELGEGCARVVTRSDSAGHILEEDYFGADLEYVSASDVPARVIWERAERGRPLEVRYFNAQGLPQPDGWGATWRTYRYDSAPGPHVEILGGFLDQRPYLTRHHIVDVHDRITQVSYRGPGGEPTTNQFGVYLERRSYDQQGRLIAEAYFGANEEPIENGVGAHRNVCSYDSDGNVAEADLLNLAGEPVFTRVLVAEVRPGSQAAELGIRTGDIVLEYDGQTKLNSSRLPLLTKLPGAQPRELVLLRDAERITFEVSPGTIGIILTDQPLHDGVD